MDCQRSPTTFVVFLLLIIVFFFCFFVVVAAVAGIVVTAIELVVGQTTYELNIILCRHQHSFLQGIAPHPHPVCSRVWETWDRQVWGA